MTVIRIDTAQVQDVGRQFITKQGELESLLQQARSLMSSLQGAFTGTRATRIFQEWDGMQPNLDGAMRALQAAGELLSRASQDFGAVDQGL
jgi:WXG100 family type VII secretion target